MPGPPSKTGLFAVAGLNPHAGDEGLIGKEEETITRLARVGYDFAIGYLKGGIEAWEKAGKSLNTVTRITADEFAKQYAESELLVFDVRKKSEFGSEHIIGAYNTPLGTINEHLAEFPKDKPFVLHCAGGYRSMIASSILKQRGWDNFVDVVGGFAAIAAAGVPKTDYVCPTTLL